MDGEACRRACRSAACMHAFIGACIGDVACTHACKGMRMGRAPCAHVCGSAHMGGAACIRGQAWLVWNAGLHTRRVMRLCGTHTEAHLRAVQHACMLACNRLATLASSTKPSNSPPASSSCTNSLDSSAPRSAAPRPSRAEDAAVATSIPSAPRELTGIRQPAGVVAARRATVARRAVVVRPHSRTALKHVDTAARYCARAHAPTAIRARRVCWRVLAGTCRRPRGRWSCTCPRELHDATPSWHSSSAGR
eukprot:364496-Chlamydomonas_euryale.AAC.53